MRSKRVVWLGLVLVAACGGSVEKSDCNDGIDNDGDLLIDDLDPGCAFNDTFTEAPDPVQCNNTLDDDGDGRIDAADIGCENAMDDEEQDPTRQCNDGVDNDGDDRVDHPQDTGCESPIDDDEYNPAACENQVDDDMDGRIDYPFDPGCVASDDDDETDPVVTPQCADGLDNDVDMLIDFGQDPGCDFAGDDDEYNDLVGPCGPGIVVTDLTATGTAMGSVVGPAPNELLSPECNGYGSEHAYRYVVSAQTALVISTDHPDTTLDTVVYIREECRRDDTELGCNDDGPQPRMSNRGSVLVLPLVDPGPYFVIVDAFSPSSLGDFTITVEERTPLHAPCVDTAECAPGTICRPLTPGDPTTCEFHECGDGLDNDGDGDIDYPWDDGCPGDADDTELHTGAPLQCADGVDNDGDTFADYPDDPGCDFAADNVELDECYPGKPVEYLDPVTGVTGTTSGATGVTGGTCGGSDSPEMVYALTPSVELVSISVDTDNATTTPFFDTILYVRADECATGTEVTCNHDISPFNTFSQVTWDPTLGTTYFVFIDSQWGGVGTFHLDVSGVIAGGAECDPGIPSFVCESGFACRESTPGATDWLCRTAFCNDDVDNDADGFTDYPFDPGCDTLSDDNENFPNPIRECSDGVDNDADGFMDYPADIGCSAASDNAEINDCVPGQPVTDHPGGTVSGDTSGAPSLLSSPTVCDPGITTGTSPEEVWVFNNTGDLTNITFSTQGSSFDTILYIRYGDCATAGPDSYCNNDSGGSSSLVSVNDPLPGYYYAIVDGNWGGAGAYNLTITGIINVGGACNVGDTNFVCTAGSACGASGTCEPTACFDGIDNDVPPDGDADYPADPGCDSINDTSETDPATAPQCADGIDNDADGDIDWPMDSSCGAASDDDEACLVFGTTAGGYSGCTDDLPVTPPCEDITATGTLACSGDDCSTSITLPFTFTFFGTPQTTVSMISNGKLGFPGTTSYSNSCTIENNTIAVYWDDLYPPSGGSLRYQTFGTAPNRRQVFQWNIPHITDPFGTAERYDLRAVLHEGTNDIEICYVDTVTLNTFTDNGLSATVGIRGTAASDVIDYSCNTATVTSGMYMRYDAP